MSHCRAHSGEEVQPRISDANAMFSSLNRLAFQGSRNARSSRLFPALRAHDNSNSQLATAYQTLSYKRPLQLWLDLMILIGQVSKWSSERSMPAQTTQRVQACLVPLTTVRPIPSLRPLYSRIPLTLILGLVRRGN